MFAERAALSASQRVDAGSIMNIEKLTTSLQFIGAALALPAGAAGVYSAYHSYFSPEVVCREMRNAALITLEKNIPAEAKRVLLRKEASQFEAKCGDVEPESNTIFQVALQELDRPAPARSAPRAPRPPSPEKSAAVPRAEPATASVVAAGAPAAAVSNFAPVAAAAPAGAPAGGQGPVGQGLGSQGLGSQGLASQGTVTRGLVTQGLGRAVHGWVAIEMRKGGKVTEAYFSGYAATGQSLPGAGTVLTAMALRPIWSEPQGSGPNDPTQLQGRLKVGECVRVVGTRGSPARQWAEIEPAPCQ
jgi:GLTT repeat (6 copies)